MQENTQEWNSFKNNILKNNVIFIQGDLFMGGRQPLTKILKNFGDRVTTLDVPNGGHNGRCSWGNTD